MLLQYSTDNCNWSSSGYFVGHKLDLQIMKNKQFAAFHNVVHDEKKPKTKIG